MSKSLHRNLQAKMDSMKGPEWDSSDDEEEEEKKVVVQAKASKAKNASKTSKKGKDKTETTSEEKETEATVLYIGHLPNEFEERDLKNLLQQFGKVLNIRISRSVKSGHSRGYAFAKFEDAETTRVVAETLQGYFVGQRRLICHPVPNPKRNLFYDTDKVIKRRQLRLKKAEKERRSQLNNLEKIKEITTLLVQREQKMRSKLQKLGIDYDFPGYEACVDDGAHEISKKDKARQGSDDAEGFEQSVPTASAKSDKEAKKRKVDRTTESPSSSSRKRKDSVGSEPSASQKSKAKQDDVEGEKNRNLASETIDMTTPPNKKTKNKGANSSTKKERSDQATKGESNTPASGKKDKHDSKKASTTKVESKDERNSPSSSKKESTPASKLKETKSPSSSKQLSTTHVSQNKKNTPANADNDTKGTTNTRAGQPIKRKHNDATPTKAVTEKAVAQSEVKMKKNKKNKKRRESAP